MGELDKAVSAIEKRFGKGSIAFASKMKGLDIERMPTGSLALDLETGGGFPRGRVVEVYGELSSGKTALALKLVAEVQKAGLNCVWIDAEGCFQSAWAQKLGVDVDKLRVARAETAERILDMADAVIRSKECGLVVIDSIAALMPKLEEEVSMEDNEKLGDRALLVNRFVRKVHSALNMNGDYEPTNKCLVLAINQMREKIGVMYGDPNTTTGGKGLGFAASIRVNVRRKEWIKVGSGESEKIVGQTIKFRITKNKTFPPYRDGEFDFYFSNGGSLPVGSFDMAREVVTYGIFYGLVKQNGAHYAYEDNRWVGKEKVTEHFRKNDAETARLRGQILEIALRAE